MEINGISDKAKPFHNLHWFPMTLLIIGDQTG
jgi:hypothetical protein